MTIDAVKKQDDTVPTQSSGLESQIGAERANEAQLAQAKLTESALLLHTSQPAKIKTVVDHLDITNPYKEKSAQKIESTFAKTIDWVSGAADVAEQGLKGTVLSACHSIVQHPGKVFVTVGEGALIGLGAAAAAPVAAALGAGAVVVAGVGVVAEVTVLGLTAAGAIASAEGVYHAVSSSAASVDVLMNKSAHNDQEIAAARVDCRTKLGEAGVDTAQGALMALGGAGVGMKLASRIGSLTRGAEGAAVVTPEGTTDGAGKPTITPAAKTEPIYEDASKAKDSRALAERPTAPEDNTERKFASLPPGSVERFSKRLKEFETDNDSPHVHVTEEKLTSLDTKAAELRIKLLNKTYYNLPKGRAPLVLSSEALSDLKTTRKMLKDYPGASKVFEQYAANRAEHAKLSTALESNIAPLRARLAQIVNEEAKNLFPDGVVPEFSVTRLPPDGATRADYANGTIRIPDSTFDAEKPLLQMLMGDDLPGLLVHEMTHGEQDGLMVRYYIDEITNHDTSGRPLTTAETDAVTKKYAAATSRTLPEKMVAEINAKREGRPLTTNGAMRAKLVEHGRQRLSDERRARRAAESQLEFLSNELENVTESPSTALYILQDEDTLKSLFHGSIPDEIKTLQDKISLEDSEGDLYDLNFVADAAETLASSLSTAIREAKAKIDGFYDVYRDCDHEKESWRAGTEANKRLGVKEETEVISMLKKFLDSELAAFDDEDGQATD